MNFNYEGIGFNGPWVAANTVKTVIKEFAHQLTKEQATELHALCSAQYGTKSEYPVQSNEISSEENMRVAD